MVKCRLCGLPEHWKPRTTKLITIYSQDSLKATSIKINHNTNWKNNMTTVVKKFIHLRVKRTKSAIFTEPKPCQMGRWRQGKTVAYCLCSVPYVKNFYLKYLHKKNF